MAKRTGGPGTARFTARQARQAILDTLPKLDSAKVLSGPDKGKKRYPKGYLYYLAEQEPKVFADLLGRCSPRGIELGNGREAGVKRILAHLRQPRRRGRSTKGD